MVLVWMCLEVINVIIYIVVVISMIIMAASGKRPQLVYHLTDIGTNQTTSISKVPLYRCPCVNGEDTQNKIWATAILASAYYIIYAGMNYNVKDHQSNVILANISGVTIYFWKVVYSYYNKMKELTTVKPLYKYQP